MAKTKVTKSKLSETKQVGKFGLVGIINTLLDFALFNLFIIYFGFGRIPANVISTTAAMTFSFFANKSFVFGNRSRRVWVQAALFLVITAFGLYVIQNAVIYTLTELWHYPLSLAYDVVTFLGLDRIFSETFVVNNGAKVIATLFSMTWNYIMYKKVVFKS